MLLLDLFVEEEKEVGSGVALGAVKKGVERGLVEHATRVHEHDVVVDAVEDEGHYQRGLALFFCGREVYDAR